MKKFDLSGVGREDLDPGVEAALGKSDRRASVSHMSTRERKAKAKADAKAKARQGKQALYDLDPTIIQRIHAMAEELGTSNSQVAQLALALFLQAVERGDIDPLEYRKPLHGSPRYLYALEISNNSS